MDAPFYIRPEFFDRVEVRVEKRKIPNNYFIPSRLNIVVASNLNSIIDRVCIQNIMAGVNLSNQLILLPSDPTYVEHITDRMSANLITIHYALLCLKGMTLNPDTHINIFTPHDYIHEMMFPMFNFIRYHRGDINSIKNYRSTLVENSIHQNIFNSLLDIEYFVHMIYYHNDSRHNHDNELYMFRRINKEYPDPTYSDLLIFESLDDYLRNSTIEYNKSNMDSIGCLNNRL